MRLKMAKEIKKTMKSIIDNKNRGSVKIWLLFVGIILAYHLLFREYTGDAVEYFSHRFDNNTLLEALKIRYEGWTSRLLLESLEIYFSTNMKMLSWSIANMFMYCILAASLMELTDHKADSLVASLLLVYPVLEMGSAGWLSTFIVYLWPLATGCFAAVSLKMMAEEKKIRGWRVIVTLICVVFSTNSEQFAVVYFCVLFLFAVYMFNCKRFSPKTLSFFLVQLALCLGNIIFALTCPGNAKRQIAEISTWMKDFPALSVVDKFVLGVNSTFSAMTDRNLLFFVFLTTIVGLVFLSKKKNLYVPASFLMGVLCLRTVGKSLAAVYFPELNALFDHVSGEMRIDSITYTTPSSYFPFVIYILLIMAVVYILLNLSEKAEASLLMAFMFCVGILSRLIMGFSPTLYASGSRTFLFFDGVLIYLTVKALDYGLRDHMIGTTAWIRYGKALCIIASISTLSNFVAICTRY